MNSIILWVQQPDRGKIYSLQKDIKPNVKYKML